MPKVSIVIPCYNAEAFLARTIESVLAQDFDDWEMIVVDDGSKDRSSAIAQSFVERDSRVQLIHQPNGGAARARNAGLSATWSGSDYIAFLDADDLYKPGALTFMIRYLDQHGEVGVVGGEYDFIDANDISITPSSQEHSTVWRYAPYRWGVRAIPNDEPDTPFIALFSWCRFIPSASLFRRSILQQTRGFRTDLVIGHDVDLFLHCTLLSEVHFIPQPLVQYRRHGAQLTASLAAIRKEEQKLWGIWREGKDLNPEQRQRVAEAWRFKEMRFVPHLFQQWGRDHLRAGDYREALICFARAARKRLFA